MSWFSRSAPPSSALLRRLRSVIPLTLAATVALSAPATQAQQTRTQPARVASPRSAPVSNLRYEVTFDSAAAQTRTLRLAVSFDVGPDTTPVLLSFPTWTPGAYEVSNFARWVSGFEATAGGRALRWDKLDPDTWRIYPGGRGTVTVRYNYTADTLDNAMAWSRPDFVLFNGTNVFPYPEGRGFDFPATVTVQTEPGWKVATGMRPGGAPFTYREANYHDLVDMPFFIGQIDYDSMVVDGRTTRLATYPAGILTGQARAAFWEQIGKMIPAMAAVFQETPWDAYTTLIIFDSSYAGGSALEHQNSHVGIYNPAIIGNPLLASITAHEIFHAWNVKRLRPADLVPYAYDRAQPTPWLWVSEGITDYYADLALVRPGIVDSTVFFGLTGEKIQTVAAAPPTALEDASLSTWIHPTDGSAYLYYPKGSLAGLLLDILIRDASDNARSLDDIMRELYRNTYKRGRGFTGADWWGAVSRAAGGHSFTAFSRRWIDGREPFPYDSVFALAGLRLTVDTIREPRLGIAAAPDSAGIRVAQIQPGGVADEAGVKPGDILLALGDLSISDPNFGMAYRERFANAEGQDLPITVSRDGQKLTLTGKVRLVQTIVPQLEPVPDASPKAARIRNGILTGKTG